MRAVTEVPLIRLLPLPRGVLAVPDLRGEGQTGGFRQCSRCTREAQARGRDLEPGAARVPMRGPGTSWGEQTTERPTRRSESAMDLRSRPARKRKRAG